MNTNDSAKVAFGSILPSGNIKNGTMFLKLDGISDGLYVMFNSTWLRIGKITDSEPMVMNEPTSPEPTFGTAAFPVEQQPLSIMFGGNF